MKNKIMEIGKYLELINNKNSQDLWNTAEATLRKI